MSEFQTISGDHADYLRDESRKTGHAESISFPVSEADLVSNLKKAASASMKVTLQGARTGITAGAVPFGGHVINLSRMDRILRLRKPVVHGQYTMTVQPGVLLAEINNRLHDFKFSPNGWDDESLSVLKSLKADKPHFFAPDPTEASASIAGMVACNASGARSFLYGPTRAHISRIRGILADGSVFELHRGREKTTGRSFTFTTIDEKKISGQIPSYRMPGVKNASGYYATENMDIMDILIGSEGTLCAFSEIDIKLLECPQWTAGILAYFPDEVSAVRFVEQTRIMEPKPAAIEFFDAGSLNLLRNNASLPVLDGLPIPTKGVNSAVYVELHSNDEYEFDEAIERVAVLIAQTGGDADSAIMATDPHEIEKLKKFRHAVPEMANMTIDERKKYAPEITKLGTDFAVPASALTGMLRIYRNAMEKSGHEHVIFGHIGDCHVHVNILPRSQAEYDAGKSQILEWAAQVVSLGGTVSAEHGVGKIKVTLLKAMYGEKGIREMMELKRVFDPDFRLNPGNLFEI
jgi:D-lactate dehydrogenase (cytochrome)